MAFLTIDDYIDIGTGNAQTAASWQVALDANFTQIIDESLNDTTHLKIWHSMLPMIGTPGQYYADLDALYGRVKVHVNQYESAWFNVPVMSQNVQNVIITENGQPDIHTTSAAINMQ